MFKHILVPIDIHFHTPMTLVAAAAFAQEQGADVTLLYVQNVVPDVFKVPFTSIAQEDVEHLERDAASFLKNAASVVAEHGVRAFLQIARGSPVDAVIRERAAACNADLIVMGTHGRAGLAHILWGSVAEDLVRNSSVPVLVTHEAGRKRIAPRRVRRIR